MAGDVRSSPYSRPLPEVQSYIDMQRSVGWPGQTGEHQMLGTAYYGNTDDATLQNNLASVYNTYGPPQGNYNAFAPNDKGGFDDPAVDLIDRFVKFRDNYKNYVNEKAPQLMDAYAPYLQGGGGALAHGQVQAFMQPQIPKQLDPHGHYGALNPYYNPSVRQPGWQG